MGQGTSTWVNPLRAALGAAYPPLGFVNGHNLRVSGSDLADIQAQLEEAASYWRDVPELMSALTAVRAGLEEGHELQRIFERLGARPLRSIHIDQAAGSQKIVGWVLPLSAERLLLILTHTGAGLDMKVDEIQRKNQVAWLFQLILRLEPRLERMEWTRADRFLRNLLQASGVIEAAITPVPGSRPRPVVLWVCKERIDLASTESDQIQRGNSALIRAQEHATTVASTSQSAKARSKLSLAERNAEILRDEPEPARLFWSGALINRPYGWKPVPSKRFGQEFERIGSRGYVLVPDDDEHDRMLAVCRTYVETASPSEAARTACRVRLRIRDADLSSTDGQPADPETPLHPLTYENAVFGTIARAGTLEQMASGQLLHTVTTNLDDPDLQDAFAETAVPLAHRPGFYRGTVVFPWAPFFTSTVEEQRLLDELRVLAGRERRGSGGVRSLVSIIGLVDETGDQLRPQRSSGRLKIHRVDRSVPGPHPPLIHLATVSERHFLERFSSSLAAVMADLRDRPDIVAHAAAATASEQRAQLHDERMAKIQALQLDLEAALDHEAVSPVGSDEERAAQRAKERIRADIEVLMAAPALPEEQPPLPSNVTLDSATVLLACLDELASSVDSPEPQQRTLPPSILREFARAFEHQITVHVLADAQLQASTLLVLRPSNGADLRIPLTWTVPILSPTLTGPQRLTRLDKQIREILWGTSLDDVLELVGVHSRSRARTTRERDNTRALWRQRAVTRLADMGCGSSASSYALLDCPIPDTRQKIWSMLRGREPQTRWEEHLLSVYSDPHVRQDKRTWLSAPTGPIRALLEALATLPDADAWVPRRTLVLGLGLDDSVALAAIQRRLVESEGGAVRSRRCEACGAPMSGYLPCLELRFVDGLFCTVCRQLPGIPDHALDFAYLRFWTLARHPDSTHPRDAVVVEDFANNPDSPTPVAGFPARLVGEQYGMTARRALAAAGTVNNGVVTGQRGARLITPRGVQAVAAAADLDLLNRTAAAELVGVEPTVVTAAVENGVLPARPPDAHGRRLVRRVDVLKWADGGLQGRLNVAQAARHMGLRRPVLEQLIAQGDVPHFTLETGRAQDRKYFKTEDLDRVSARRSMLRVSEAARLAQVSGELVKQAVADGSLVPDDVLYDKPRFRYETVLRWATGGFSSEVAERVRLRSAARVLGLTDFRIRRLVESGEVRAFTLTQGGHMYCLRSDLDAAR